MKIKNVRGRTLDIPAAGLSVEAGVTVEVDSDLGKSLLEQPANWAKPKPVKAKAKTAASTDAADAQEGDE